MVAMDLVTQDIMAMSSRLVRLTGLATATLACLQAGLPATATATLLQAAATLLQAAATLLQADQVARADRICLLVGLCRHSSR
jgi:hypothetical protein